VPDLVYLADEHPLDETITGLLMLALHRRGRPVEALERYALIRRRLVDQLGDGPGDGLRDPVRPVAAPKCRRSGQ
jgi:DNA-binding SARP family transcriptional activator